MKHSIYRFPMIIVGLVLMALLAACTGVAGPTPGNPVTVTGTIKSVDASHGSVTMTVNGQTITINGLTSAQATALQSQVGKTFRITATQNSDGSYTISSNTNPVSASGSPEGIETPSSNETPNPNETPNATEPGSISFIGKVQSVSSSNIVVSMPGGSTLSMAINAQTDRSDFNGGLPSVGALIMVDAKANPDGSFTATKLGQTDQSDASNANKLNTIDFHGVTTSAVGSDRVIHFNVGSKSFSFAIASTADLSAFNNNAQAIGNNQAVKVEVLFNGSTGTVVKVSNSNG